jgi:hypothetical protein
LLSVTEKFCQFERSAGNVFFIISNDRGCFNPITFEVVKQSVTLLFKLPSNSFLHNFAVDSIQMLVDRGESINELIEETHLVEQILTNYADGFKFN